MQPLLFAAQLATQHGRGSCKPQPPVQPDHARPPLPIHQVITPFGKASRAPFRPSLEEGGSRRRPLLRGRYDLVACVVKRHSVFSGSCRRRSFEGGGCLRRRRLQQCDDDDDDGGEGGSTAPPRGPRLPAGAGAKNRIAVGGVPRVAPLLASPRGEDNVHLPEDDGGAAIAGRPPSSPWRLKEQRGIPFPGQAARRRRPRSITWRGRRLRAAATTATAIALPS